MEERGQTVDDRSREQAGLQKGLRVGHRQGSARGWGSGVVAAGQASTTGLHVQVNREQAA